MAHAEASALPATAAHTIAEMAQRDLDAALQLLADRAQYITGANGAAIALRRDGKKDMQCRASTGSNVPGLGALLSTEFGLSGESVRTRQPMRCDDAARDARVNHDVCREMGIASVVVMPVVHDDEVLGVFELFSGKVNAFGERDVSALHRLSGLVETAVRLARASVQVSAGIREEVVAPSVQPSAVEAEPIGVQVHNEVADLAIKEDVVPEAIETSRQIPQIGTIPEPGDAGMSPFDSRSGQVRTPQEIRTAQEKFATPEATAVQDAHTTVSVPVQPIEPKKALFWSAALDASASARAAEDQSQVPPMLRNLRKCQACGFPVSSDRTLCVECEEKKWRGQLRVPKPVAARPSSPERSSNMTAAAAAKAVDLPRQAPGPGSATPHANEKAAPTTQLALSDVVATQRPSSDSASERVSPDGAPILTGGLAPSESWFAANKYIVGAVLVVAAIVGAILLLR